MANEVTEAKKPNVFKTIVNDVKNSSTATKVAIGATTVGTAVGTFFLGRLTKKNKTKK